MKPLLLAVIFCAVIWHAHPTNQWDAGKRVCPSPGYTDRKSDSGTWLVIFIPVDGIIIPFPIYLP